MTRVSHQLRCFSLQGLWLFGLVLGFALSLAAQQPATTAGSSDSAQPRQQDKLSSISESTSIFIGYATNKSFIFPDIATSAGPLSTGGKFKLFVNQSISPPYILAAASGAAINQARDSPKGMAKAGVLMVVGSA